MSFEKLQEILDCTQERHIPFWKVILEDDCTERSVSEEESFETMRHMYRAMKEADTAYDAELRSASGMAGGDGAKLEQFRRQGNHLVGDYLSEVMEKAVKMAESNACMRRIVAAPTAGSCGVIPAVLLTYQKQKGTEENRMVEALFVAAGIGEVIAASASIAGAEGGCQAEIGSASAMAAGAVAYLENGGEEDIVHAAALALKNMLGLTCDPVAGLVEVPCIKRNVSGAVNAVTSSQMALAGVRSVIPPDEVIDSMRRIGRLLPACLRETSQEGLATTPTGQQVAKRMRS
ncbi:L-serine ammonia-lyase, iron-sulfur-dependent, subunit alpha [Butyricicoccus porcorum]|uniref:L-serine dehydratase n=1 Tax=Butyricicoccus porcorum TaxID=1945634 RepID=A0A252F7L2_9FIRM|nr:L-serine ammonia-lyase, iron-sulfur-dependent, subunit alpha [Butyricicoccus porcorum]MCI6927559.1 L-serine ammonia-lyase, iron-sulfur-dependent, subunit alpha [Butyricicoccus porcorum]MDD6986425.1 L-serine ammonia-lyase, iron-sulfur-dependent, subunit alpha [Butyricicoccus porcorum]MDY4483521.1 L-serine ammonia-lyase, iron-sulfur-dependent, subunit alpha [Butyricicoccus porcorum]OUM21650.1 L-serine ammonia-lyase, iron-sulfur-dependent, subunit alpha [Butyricicoccus porcorum]